VTFRGVAPRVRLGAEVALALGAGLVAFTVVAVTLANTDSDLLAVALAAVGIAAIVTVTRFWSIAPAVPVAMASLLAFDWFQFPPTHPREFPSSADLADLFAYLGVAVLVGELAAYASRRAEVTEVARSALANEQAVLRRVATMVAQGMPESDLFRAVTAEVGGLLGSDMAGMVQFEPDDTVVVVAGWAATGGHADVSDERLPLDDADLAARILSTGRSARADDFTEVRGPIAAGLRKLGVVSAVGSPIVVEGRIWGALFVHTTSPHPFPADTESRLLNFTELVATAIANAQARFEVRRLAGEQAALRRVATLVAREASPAEVFTAVVREVRGLLGAQDASMVRYDADGNATVVADLGPSRAILPVGTLLPEGGNNITSLIRRTQQATRIDDYATATGFPGDALRDHGLRSAVGVPIMVEGRLWGAMMAGSRTAQQLPRDTELRMGAFTELVATALANTEARAALALRIEEQQALRRVATLVAQGASQVELFDAVASEASRMLDGEATSLLRYDPEGSATVVAQCGDIGFVGLRVPPSGDSVTARVLRTGRAARLDSYDGVRGSEVAIGAGVGASVGAPIVVESRPWGLIAAMSREHPLPAGTEDRLEQFADLVAAAISNAESRTELAASRARIVAAADDERRRVVRDLHDGAQQRLVHTVVTLKLARRALQKQEQADPLVTEALEQAQRATVELRELAHGILPAVLTRGGLRAGVEALASRMPVPTEVDVSADRLPTAIEATAYFVVAEALTNVAKHAGARNAVVAADIDDDTLRVRVQDNGAGGAQSDGSGLQGIADRVAALGGRLSIESPADGGTLIAAAFPLGGDR
jgi:signal transduction histidine kinase